MSLVQKSLNTTNATFPKDICVSWLLMLRLQCHSPVLVKLSQATLFPSSQFYMNMLWSSTLQVTSPFHCWPSLGLASFGRCQWSSSGQGEDCWLAVKSAVLNMIVVACTELRRGAKFFLMYWTNSNLLKLWTWLNHFHELQGIIRKI